MTVNSTISTDELIDLITSIKGEAMIREGVYFPHDKYKWVLGSDISRRVLETSRVEVSQMLGINVDIDRVNPWKIELWKEVTI